MLQRDLVNVVSKGKSVPVIGQLGVGIATVVGIVIATEAVVFIQNAAAQNQLEEGREKFRQMAAVFQHTRCMNCHPRTDFPRQGDDRHRHVMNVTRGPADRGAPGLHCSTCHQSSNQTASGVPGAPDWHLAPPRMAWDGLSAAELCRALLDPARGGMKPNQFIPHFQTGLVRWAWSPGAGPQGEMRAAPPISYERFMALTREWIDRGAPCPDS
jgi:cytochrome c553